MAGTYGLDISPLPQVSVVARIDAPHIPFADGTLARVYAKNVLEHLPNLGAAMDEIWRVLAPGGHCAVEVPYFASVSAHADPTHVRAFTYSTFEHFGGPSGGGARRRRNLHTWLGTARLDIRSRRLVFGRAHRWLGIAWLANYLPVLYENLFVYWFPARALELELVKRSAAA